MLALLPTANTHTIRVHGGAGEGGELPYLFVALVQKCFIFSCIKVVSETSQTCFKLSEKQVISNLLTTRVDLCGQWETRPSCFSYHMVIFSER
jgi:hypothetical protein